MAEEKKTSKKADKAEKSKDTKKKSKKNPFKSIASFFKSVKSEGKKVVWAKPKEVLRNTIIVIIVCTIVGVAIYGVDTVLSLGMKGLKSLADKESTSVSQDVDTTADGETTQEDTTAESTTEAAE
ncbi:MAG: preprotein translocase subunit SecE [Eubacterium sp.]|nr:preprotein translocase subunit SecE [Eubacterium sp.]